MQPPIQIKKNERSISISFSYNQDLVDIMREENGLWHRKTKAWIFPLTKLSYISDILISQRYKVRIISDTTKHQI